MNRIVMACVFALAAAGCGPSQPGQVTAVAYPADSRQTIYLPIDCGHGDTIIVKGSPIVYLAPVRRDTVVVGWVGGDSVFVWFGGHEYRMTNDMEAEDWRVEREARRLIAEGIAFNRRPR